MEWGGGVIGWWASRSPYGAMDSYSQDYYDWHYLSGDPDSNTIGCLYSSTYSAIVYKLTCEYVLYMYINPFLYIILYDYVTVIVMLTADYCGDQHTWHTCVNGQCVYKPRVNRCDGKDDCRDGSDEWDCGFHGNCMGNVRWFCIEPYSVLLVFASTSVHAHVVRAIYITFACNDQLIALIFVIMSIYT